MVASLVVCWLLPADAAADDRSNEYMIKAAYIYNFTKFVTWPPDPSPTFNLCIVGQDPFNGLIDPIQKRTVSTRPIKIYRLPNAGDSTAKPPAPCHIVFSSAPMPPIKNPGVSLTVGERDHFAKAGGMIEFIEQGGRIKLLVNLGAVNKSKLKISAKLLEVAEILPEETP